MGHSLSKRHLRSGLAIVPGDARSVVAVFENQGHWACLSLTAEEDGATMGIYLDGLDFRLREYAERAAEAICRSWGKKLASFRARQWFTQEPDIGCGTVAVAHAALVVGGQHVASMQALRRLHSNLLAISPTHGLHAGRGDLAKKEHNTLKDLLLGKGVPEEKVADRIKDICKKVGVSEVAKAMNAASPWQQMKAIASRPGNMFRLVHPEELQQKIREKAAETLGAVPQGGRKKRKQVAPGRTAPALYVEPKALSLVEGSFSAADGQAMHQIKFEEVTADSHGLAFCTCAQAAPFLQGEVLSADPLCLVTQRYAVSAGEDLRTGVHNLASADPLFSIELLLANKVPNLSPYQPQKAKQVS